MYDVIVVGAGPAGSTAAKGLAEKGLRVLLVERHKLPRYKSCSGVLIQKTMELVRKYFGQDVPLSAMCTPAKNHGMIFTTDTGRESRYCTAQAIAKHFGSPDMARAGYRQATQPIKSYMERQWDFVERMAGTFSEMTK